MRHTVRIFIILISINGCKMVHAQLSPFYNMDSTWYYMIANADTNPVLVEKLKLSCSPSHRFSSKDFSKLSQYPNLKYLDLSGCYLKKVPIEVLKLKNLKALNLSYNYLKELPDELSQLKNLETLLVNWSYFKEFPKVIQELPKLKCLQFKYIHELINPYESLQMISSLSNLEELQFYHFKYDSELQEIPCEIANLKKMRFLTIEARDLTGIPNCLGELKNLEHLYFGNPSGGGSNIIINKFPESLCGLTKLTHLMIQDVAFEVFPSNIKNLKKLQYLSIQIPATIDTPSIRSFSNLDLITLDIDLDYKMKFIPSQFCEIKSLKGFVIFGNQVQGLPENIGALLNLENLGIYVDNVKILPNSFCQLVKLKKIRFGQGCQLTRLSECFINLINLEVLDLGYCNNLQWPILLNPDLKLKYLSLKMDYGNKFYPMGPIYPSTPDPIYEWQYVKY